MDVPSSRVPAHIRAQRASTRLSPEIDPPAAALDAVGATTHSVASFHNHDARASLSEPPGAHQSRQPGADDHGVGGHPRQIFSRGPHRKNHMSAAMRQG